MRGGVESPHGIDTPRVEELPWGDETSGVIPEGEGLPREDGRGGREDRTHPTTQETEACGDSGGDEGATGGPGPAPHQQRGTASGDSAETLYRHTDIADGPRSEHIALVCRKYILMAPAELSGDPIAAETQVSGDGHKATMGTDYQDQRKTKTGDGTG